VAAPVSQRCRFVQAALEQLGAPYLWGAKGQIVADKGVALRAFDCSGLVTWCFRLVGGADWCATHNTDRLWDECRPTQAQRAGTLVLYGPPGNPNHVMILLGEGVVVGASGGGSRTVTLALARDARARVKPFSHYTYRPDVLGFRDLPFTD
jgi:murein DD-endopeptidase